jgi:CheY-like chemotaxis protein/two-component sensor histidine kinase
LAYAGRWQPVTQRIDLSERIRSVGALLRSAVPRSIDFAVHLPSELPLVDADPVQLQQVVMNLIANAVEAIGDRAGRIDLRVERMRVDAETAFANVLGPPPEPAEYVLIGVADDGRGMPGDVHERIFEPFYTTKENGHGLGLAAVLGIVRRHRGALEVASAPGEGTVFRLLLPTAERVGEPVGKIGQAPTGFEFRGRGTVLVVDDEELVRKTARRLLEHLGFAVVTAADGSEALARFDERGDGFVLGLIDLVMPGMDGVELCRRLRERDPRTRLVLSSAHDPPEPDPDDPAGQFHAFLRKPYGPRELAEVLRRVLPADASGPE